MNCRHCGATVDLQKKFCPDCGGMLSEDANLEGAPKQRSIFWLKTLLGILFLGVFGFIAAALLSNDITDSVSNQLEDIRKGKIAEAYANYTSKTFQESTSIEGFEKFLESYPQFSQSTSVRFVDRNVDNDAGVLQARLLMPQGDEIPVQYSLVKEGGNWKVVNITFENTTPVGQEDSFDETPLIKVVKDQLEMIRHNKLKEAYEAYTSKGFKKATSFAAFEMFLHDQPVLTANRSVDLKDVSFDNNIVNLSGKIIAANGTVYPVDYDLVEEDGVWKILHINVDKPLQGGTSDASPMKVSKYVLGNEVNPSGIVTMPRTIFKADSGDIYLNLFISHAKANTDVGVIFEHVDTLSRIPPVTARISEDGNVTIMFIFSPPKAGWPIGNYRIRVNASTGLIDSYDFKVEGKS